MPIDMMPQFMGAASGGLFGALGIDWQMLIFQIVGFVVLVWFMGKFVFPPLFKTVDERQAKIDESLKAATEAEAKAKKAKDEIIELMKSARQDANEIVVTAHDEAAAAVATAEQKAEAQAKHLVSAAHDEIAREVIAAKKALHNETIELVVQATEKVVGRTLSDAVDKKMIKNTIGEAK